MGFVSPASEFSERDVVQKLRGTLGKNLDIHTTSHANHNEQVRVSVWNLAC